MRIALVLSLTLVACATDATGPTAMTSEITISLSRAGANNKPNLVVRIANNSFDHICIWRDAIQNPYSYEMDLKMRDARKRAVEYNEPGYIDEPLEGVVRLEPGGTAEGRFYIHPRFKLRNPGKTFPHGMSVRASFSYHRCNDRKEFRATSSWQPI